MEVRGYTIAPNANLRGANLRGANLWGANLREANLREANLREANLRGADLVGADLWEANLWGADLGEANLVGANLRGANLRGADLSGCRGLVSATEWLKANFKVHSSGKGYVVYKAFGQFHRHPWGKIRGGKWVREAGVNPDHTTDCGSGVNFGTLDWDFGDLPIWECLLTWENLADLVVPINGGNKARCAALKVLRRKGE